jgi:hypothetical protein
MQKGKKTKRFVRDIASVRMTVWECGSFEAEPSQGIRFLPICIAWVSNIFWASLTLDKTDTHDSDAIKIQFFCLLRDYR